ncbi:MAG: FHA domain-containing protein, partial [Victivallales bacterium]|nr:FHA domain-containing protein [Victivallales bacterium]
MPNVTIYNSVGERLAIFSTEGFSSSIKIGRSSECQICLKGLADTTISRVHLILIQNPFGWKLRNNSKTGMYKNCIKVDEVELKEGDLIRFGALFLGFGNLSGPSPFDLVWTAETENGHTQAVLWPGRNSIGSSRDNYVCIRTDDISRIHSFITVTGNHAVIRSATLSNACLVNGEEIGEEEFELKPNDVIQLADTEVKFVHAVRVSFQD